MSERYKSNSTLEHYVQVIKFEIFSSSFSSSSSFSQSEGLVFWARMLDQSYHSCERLHRKRSNFSLRTIYEMSFSISSSKLTHSIEVFVFQDVAFDDDVAKIVHVDNTKKTRTVFDGVVDDSKRRLMIFDGVFDDAKMNEQFVFVVALSYPLKHDLMCCDVVVYPLRYLLRPRPRNPFLHTFYEENEEDLSSLYIHLMQSYQLHLFERETEEESSNRTFFRDTRSRRKAFSSSSSRRISKRRSPKVHYHQACLYTNLQVSNEAYPRNSPKQPKASPLLDFPLLLVVCYFLRFFF